VIKTVSQFGFVPKTMTILTPTEALQTHFIPERSNNPAPTRSNPFRTINKRMHFFLHAGKAVHWFTNGFQRQHH